MPGIVGPVGPVSGGRLSPGRRQLKRRPVQRVLKPKPREGMMTIMPVPKSPIAKTPIKPPAAMPPKPEVGQFPRKPLQRVNPPAKSRPPMRAL